MPPDPRRGRDGWISFYTLSGYPLHALGALLLVFILPQRLVAIRKT
jgi:hypothetical protein